MKKILVHKITIVSTYNLVHYLEDLDCEVTVYRNDEFDIDEIAVFDKILLESMGTPVYDYCSDSEIRPTKSILGYA
jgi:anthranilate synthase component 2